MATVKGGAASRALFKHMDLAGSGRIQYEELRLAVRDTLRLDKRELPEPKLQGLWKVLDEEGSGFIGAGESGPLETDAQARSADPRTRPNPRLALKPCPHPDVGPQSRATP